MQHATELKEKIAQLTAALNAEVEKTREKDKRITTLSTDLAEKTGELEGERREVESLKQRLVELNGAAESQRSQLRSAVSETQAQAERLTRTLQDRDEQIKSLQTELQALQLRSANDVGRKDETIRTITARLEQRDKEIESMKQAVSSATQLKEELERTRMESDAAAEKSFMECRTLQDQNEVLSGEVDTLSARYRELQDELVAAERAKADMEEQYTVQVEFLAKNYKAAYSDVMKLSVANADLLGHQNKHQRIKYVEKIREDLRVAKEHNLKVEIERDRLRKQNMQLERDLEAYKFVAPVGPRDSFMKAAPGLPRASMTFDASTAQTPSASGRRPKLSRVKRAVMAAATSANPAAATVPSDQPRTEVIVSEFGRPKQQRTPDCAAPAAEALASLTIRPGWGAEDADGESDGQDEFHEAVEEEQPGSDGNGVGGLVAGAGCDSSFPVHEVFLERPKGSAFPGSSAGSGNSGSSNRSASAAASRGLSGPAVRVAAVAGSVNEKGGGDAATAGRKNEKAGGAKGNNGGGGGGGMFYTIT
ncbi:hypothetical protein DFJ73DRAFT_222103 [Zopfochytrium polystomum]|nr:hypothetical protein DFJ73DRAFT_222103 [Zopfochytrium polystomum]